MSSSTNKKYVRIVTTHTVNTQTASTFISINTNEPTTPTDNVPATNRPALSTAPSPASKRASFKTYHSMSDDLGEYIINDAELLEHVGWT